VSKPSTSRSSSTALLTAAPKSWKTSGSLPFARRTGSRPGRTWEEIFIQNRPCAESRLVAVAPSEGARSRLIIMTSRPEVLPTFHFPARPQTAYSDSDSKASLEETTNIPSTVAADGRPKRPGLVSRAPSESSTRTIRPRHLSTKSQSAVPTLSNLNVRNSVQPTPKMTTSTGGTSSGAADLLRQAMMQR
jgi:hypothetical protein